MKFFKNILILTSLIFSAEVSAITCPTGQKPGPLGKNCVAAGSSSLTNQTSLNADGTCPNGFVIGPQGKKCVLAKK